ncbi:MULTISPECIES: hypothetical protein [Pseudomonas]|jgi:hypothetical protein|uniref:Uncharacterized protein n=1 Tax=Pseudomonas mosselii TaxID=78327 RepID=A0A5R8Z519_9PSED|nr:hypothetical protein [Pseudomonas mosselii]TLP60036.1 hypothetical protein FEM01_12570 [Pseudomonas mosselii]
MYPHPEMVLAHLNETFQPLGIDPEAVYINQIDNVIDEAVVMSRSLLDEALHHLDQGVEPTYDQGLYGVFHEPGTFDPALRVGGLRLPDVERFVGQMLRARR